MGIVPVWYIYIYMYCVNQGLSTLSFFLVSFSFSFSLWKGKILINTTRNNWVQEEEGQVCGLFVWRNPAFLMFFFFFLFVCFCGGSGSQRMVHSETSSQFWEYLNLSQVVYLFDCFDYLSSIRIKLYSLIFIEDLEFRCREKNFDIILE